MTKFILPLLLLMTSFSWAAETPPYSLKVECKALLTTGNGDLPVQTVTSKVFENSPKGFVNSAARMSLGDYTLVGQMIMNQPFGSPSMEPTFEMSLFKGNPVQGQVNWVRTQGLDLDTRAVNTPLVLYGTNFIQFTLSDVIVSRVDYNCSLSKVVSH